MVSLALLFLFFIKKKGGRIAELGVGGRRLLGMGYLYIPFNSRGEKDLALFIFAVHIILWSTLGLVLVTRLDTCAHTHRGINIYIYGSPTS